MNGRIRVLPSSLRPAISAKWIRRSAALLEMNVLVTLGAMMLSGVVQDAHGELDGRLPLHVGVGIVPILLIAVVYAAQRITRRRRFAFVIAGALVCGVGAALHPAIDIGSRLLDGLRGLVAGAILTGIMMTLDDEGTMLQEGGIKPWRELFFAMLLITFGTFPAMIWGGFVLAVPSILMGIGFLFRCIRYDAPVVVPRRNAGAAFRIFLAMLFVLLGLGFLVVCPMISLGMERFP